MDFHGLTRKELQALCKKNKIPANLTNVAMADALGGLVAVEGVEEMLHSRQFEPAKTSTESPERSDLTSPYVPTGGRSTRRRNVVIQESSTVKPMRSTRRTFQRSLNEDTDGSQSEEISTPSMAQPSRKKAPLNSACRKIDSQMKKCAEEKGDVSAAPAHLGLTSQRRRVNKEEITITQAYSTRRSVRLAKKKGVMLNEEGHETFGLVQMDLTANYDPAMSTCMKESLELISGITGFDMETSEKEKSDEKGEAEVVSVPQQDVSVTHEAELLAAIRKGVEVHFEVGGSKSAVEETSDDEMEKPGCKIVNVTELDINNAGEIIIHPDAEAEAESEYPKDGNIEEEMINYPKAYITEYSKETSGSVLAVEEASDVEMEKPGCKIVNVAELDLNNAEEIIIHPEAEAESDYPKDENIEEEMINYPEANITEYSKETSADEVEEEGYNSQIDAESEHPKDENIEEEMTNNPEANITEYPKETSADEVEEEGYNSQIDAESEYPKDENIEEEMINYPEANIKEYSKETSADEVEEEGYNSQTDAESEYFKDENIEEEMINYPEANITEYSQETSADEVEEEGYNSQTDAARGQPTFEQSEYTEDKIIIVQQNVRIEVPENQFSQEVNTSEAEIAIVSTKEINPADHVAVKDNAFDVLENVVLESGDNAEIGGVAREAGSKENEKGINIVEEMDSGDVADFYTNTEIVQTNAEVHIDVVEKEFSLVEPSEGSHHSTCPLVCDLIQEEAPTERRNKINLAQNTELELPQTSNEVLGTKLNTESTPSGENLQHQKAPGTEVESTVVTPVKNSVGVVLVETNAASSVEVGYQKSPIVTGLDKHQFFKPALSTPTRDSASKKMSSVISDNKENIGSGSKLILTKEKPKMAKSSNAENVQGMFSFSRRQLTKMVKNKLEMIKNENENNETKAQTPARPALQALPENR